MTDAWFVMIPPSYQSASDSEKELVDFRVSYPVGSKAWQDAIAGRIVSGAEGSQGNPQMSQDLIKWKGPYNNEAQAQAAQSPRQQSVNPVNDAVNAAENSTALGWLQGLFTRANAVRLAEGILGVLLVAVAAAELGKGTAVGNLAKKVPFV